jgi:hypothetical protein
MVPPLFNSGGWLGQSLLFQGGTGRNFGFRFQLGPWFLIFPDLFPQSMRYRENGIFVSGNTLLIK